MNVAMIKLTLRKLNLLVWVINIFLISCSEERINPEVEGLLQDNTTSFTTHQIPQIFNDIFKEHELIVFGETHYVNEHQEFIVSSLPELSNAGYTLVMEELPFSYSWMVEDYVLGKRDDLPEFVLYFNEKLIEGIRQFNSTVENHKQFSLRYIDVNTFRSSFYNAIIAMEKVIGDLSLLDPILGATIDSDAYLTELESTYDNLIANKSFYEASLGIMWYTRILNLISVEIESSEFRRSKVNEGREITMFNNVSRNILDSNKKCLLNVGMFHAQKEPFLWFDYAPLTQILKGENIDLFTISFVGMRGETKNSYGDTHNISFDLSRKVSKDNILSTINQIANHNLTFTSLTNPIFSEEIVTMSYDKNTTLSVPIGRQFDAIVTYPSISTLHSMDKYSIQ